MLTSVIGLGTAVIAGAVLVALRGLERRLAALESQPKPPVAEPEADDEAEGGGVYYVKDEDHMWREEEARVHALRRGGR